MTIKLTKQYKFPKINLLKEKRQDIWEEFAKYYDDWTSLSKRKQNDIIDSYISNGGNMHQAYNLHDD